MADDIGAMHSTSASDIFTGRQAALLADNLDPKKVKKLTTGSKAQYIEGWHAIAEANRIFGFGAWDRELVRCEETNRELLDVKRQVNNQTVTEKQWRVGYLYTVRIVVHGTDGQVRRREGTGFGSGYAKLEALGEAIESAAKEAETDAMKRALMTFGNPFGLALYDKAKSSVGPSILGDDFDDDAGPSDAGQREQQKAQQATGAEANPPASAPVQPTATQTMGKQDARPDFGLMVEEMRRITSSRDLKAWGKMNAKRVQLQPKDWQGEIRKQYVDLMEGLEHQERASAEANEEFADAR